eukprot:62298_1
MLRHARLLSEIDVLQAAGQAHLVSILIVLHVASFAGLGTFIRVVLSQPMNIHPMLPLEKMRSLIPNLVGSGLLGIIKGLSSRHKYIGLATGLCGSITTFSAFSYEINVLFVNESPQIVLAITFIFITFIGSIICFSLGECFAKCVFRVPPSVPGTPIKVIDDNVDLDIAVQTTVFELISPKQARRTLRSLPSGASEPRSGKNLSIWSDAESVQSDNAPLIVQKEKDWTFCIVMTKWIIVFIVMNCIVIPLCFLINTRLWFATILGPVGAVCRWYLGKMLNKGKCNCSFPLGTFIANVSGSFLIALILLLSGEFEDSHFETFWVLALTKGFCGCFTTVSSFIEELLSLQRNAKKDIKSTKKDGESLNWIQQIGTYKWSVIYFVLTLVCSQMACSIVNLFNAFPIIKLFFTA